MARGHADRALGAPLVLLPVVLFSWLTFLLTDDPPEPTTARTSRPRLVVQLLVVLAIATLIAVSAMSFYQVGPKELGSISVWSGIFGWLLDLGRALPVPAPAAVSDPVLELALPLVLLLALGAKWQDMGFGRGHRAGRVIALWSATQLLMLGLLLVTGKAQVLRLIGVFIRNGFQNGPVEEFLFRGALMTRLAFLLGQGWGLVLSALAFGLWKLQPWPLYIAMVSAQPDQPLSGSVDEIEHIVERGGQPVNVFAIERSDKRLVKLGEDGMRDVVARVLNIMQLLHAHLDVLHGIENAFQQLRALREIGRHGGEHLKEFSFPGNQTNHEVVVLML